LVSKFQRLSANFESTKKRVETAFARNQRPSPSHRRRLQLQKHFYTNVFARPISRPIHNSEANAVALDETLLFVFMLAAFLGFQLIKRVSPLLHSPLMSLTNAISAIAVVGAITIAGEKDASPFAQVLGFVAIMASTINLVGGYLITDRMLKMFRKREDRP
jgi:NAD(P) transhydrogenase subunit alpha